MESVCTFHFQSFLETLIGYATRMVDSPTRSEV